MWRIASCVYRAFRNTATHRCSQDVLVPLTTICTADDDDDSKKNEKNKCSSAIKSDLVLQVLKKNRFTFENIIKLQEYLRNVTIQHVTPQADALEPSNAKSTVRSTSPSDKIEETLESLLKTDEACVNALNNLSDIQEETTSVINLQLAIDALESGDFQFGIETLQTCAKNGTNAVALYNLGICYERGIGVEQDRAKACDYYRQASSLGHTNAQYNLSLLSNHIDIQEDDDSDDQSIEHTPTEKRSSLLREFFVRFTLSNDYKEEPSFEDYPIDLPNQSIVCLS